MALSRRPALARITATMDGSRNRADRAYRDVFTAGLRSAARTLVRKCKEARHAGPLYYIFGLFFRRVVRPFGHFGPAVKITLQQLNFLMGIFQRRVAQQQSQRRIFGFNGFDDSLGRTDRIA